MDQSRYFCRQDWNRNKRQSFRDYGGTWTGREIPDRLSSNETYTFYLWQAFDTCQVIFRVEKDSLDHVTLTTKYFNPRFPDGRGKDTLLQVTTKALTIKDWNEVKNKIDESYFWTLEQDDNPTRDGILDGSGWTISGKRFPSSYEKKFSNFKRYTTVYRRCPYKGSFHDLGVTIAKMSNPKFEKTIY